MVSLLAEMDGVPELAEEGAMRAALRRVGRVRFAELWSQDAAAAVEDLRSPDIQIEVPDGAQMWDAFCGPAEAA